MKCTCLILLTQNGVHKPCKWSVVINIKEADFYRIIQFLQEDLMRYVKLKFNKKEILHYQNEGVMFIDMCNTLR